MEATSQESGIKTAVPTYSILAIVWRSLWLSLLSFSPALLVAILFVILRSPEAMASIRANIVIPPFIYLVIVGPMLETVLFQLTVIEILLKIGVQRAIYIVPIAAIPFIGVHFTNAAGAGSGISIIPGGFVLAYCYLYWRRKTGLWLVASTATWLTHGLHNFYQWLLNFIPASFIFGWVGHR